MNKVMEENRLLVKGDEAWEQVIARAVNALFHLDNRHTDLIHSDTRKVIRLVKGLLSFRDRGFDEYWTVQGRSSLYMHQQIFRTYPSLEGASPINTAAIKEGFGYVSYIPDNDAYRVLTGDLQSARYRSRDLPTMAMMFTSNPKGRLLGVTRMLELLMKSSAVMVEMRSINSIHGKCLLEAHPNWGRRFQTPLDYFEGYRDAVNESDEMLHGNLRNSHPEFYDESLLVMEDMPNALRSLIRAVESAKSKH